MTEERSKRTVLVDASVLITLSELDAVEQLRGIDGQITIPRAVAGELTQPPATALVDESDRPDWIEFVEAAAGELEAARARLGTEADWWADDEERSGDRPRVSGDVALLASSLAFDSPIVVTDDKPLRQVCKTLSIPVSGSIGVLVRAVERGDLDPDDARDALYAMDSVGARLSASLVRRAERLIEAAAEE